MKRGTEWSLTEEGKQWVEENPNHSKKQRQQRRSYQGQRDTSIDTPDPGPSMSWSPSPTPTPSVVGDFDFDHHLRQLGSLHRFEVEGLHARLKEMKERIQQLEEEVRTLRSEKEQLQQQLVTALPEEPISIVSGWQQERDTAASNSQLVNSKSWKNGTVQAIKYQHPLEKDLMVSLNSKSNTSNHKGLELSVLSKDFSTLQKVSITTIPSPTSRTLEGFRCVEGLVITPQSSCLAALRRIVPPALHWDQGNTGLWWGWWRLEKKNLTHFLLFQDGSGCCIQSQS
jgi:hypothetical protein